MSRMRFFLMALLGVVALLPASDVFAQNYANDNGGASARRVGVFARMRARRSSYTSSNCCEAPAQTGCCEAPVQTSCCPAPAPCCQTACCAAPAPACGCASDCHASSGCCKQGGLFANRRAHRDCENAYTSCENTCSSCGNAASTGCSSCSGCAGGQIMQGTSEGIVVPGNNIAPMPVPEAPTPAPAAGTPTSTSSDT